MKWVRFFGQIDDFPNFGIARAGEFADWIMEKFHVYQRSGMSWRRGKREPWKRSFGCHIESNLASDDCAANHVGGGFQIGNENSWNCVRVSAVVCFKGESHAELH